MAQYGQEQYGTVQYGGGVQARGTSNLSYTASGQVTSAIGTGTTTATLTPTGKVTSANDQATVTFNFTPTGIGDVVGIGDSGTASFNFDPSGTITSEFGNGTATFNFDPSGVVTFPVAPTGTRWYLNRKDKEEYIIFNGEMTNYPDVSIGDEITFEFFIDEDKDIFQDLDERYHRAVEYQKYAGYGSVTQTIASVFFKEPDTFANADIDSLLVSIEPGDGVTNARGVWGIVTEVQDGTQIYGSYIPITITVTVLAQYDDFDGEQAVRNEFEAGV